MASSMRREHSQTRQWLIHEQIFFRPRCPLPRAEQHPREDVASGSSVARIQSQASPPQATRTQRASRCRPGICTTPSRSASWGVSCRYSHHYIQPHASPTIEHMSTDLSWCCAQDSGTHTQLRAADAPLPAQTRYLAWRETES